MNIIDIVKSGNFKLLKDNLKFYDINVIDEKKNSLLHLAILKNNLEMVDFLLINSINYNWQNEDGNTPLHFAIKYDCYTLFKRLILSKVDINILNNEKETPLMVALKLGRVNMAKVLLSLNPVMDLKNYNDENIAFYCVKSNDLTLLEQIIEKDNDLLYSKNYLNDTLLHIATKKGNTKIISYLLKKGLNPNIMNNFKETPIFYAAKNNDYSSSLLLMDYYALTDIKNKFNETIFDISNKRYEQYILDKSYTLKYSNYLKNFPLHVAVMKGDLELVKMSDSIINRNKKDDFNLTACDLAIKLNHLKIIEYLHKCHKN